MKTVCDIGDRTDKLISGTEWRAEKQTHTNTINKSLNKRSKAIQQRKDNLSANGAVISGHTHAKKVNLDTSLKPFTN